MQYQTIHDVDSYGGLFDIQWGTVVGSHMAYAGQNRIYEFDWQGENETTRQKLLPFLQQTHDAFFDLRPDYEYLFCSVGETAEEAVNMLLRISDNEWMTVDSVING